MEQCVCGLDMDKRRRAFDTRHKAGANRTRSRDTDIGSTIHHGGCDPEMAGVQSDMGLLARIRIHRRLCVWRCTAQQMHDYKTATQYPEQGMSHTILKQSNQQNTGRSNTLLNEVTGTFEVYWEQLKRSAKDKWNGTRDKNEKDNNKAGYEEAAYNSDDESSQTTRRSGWSGPKSKFIESNVVFGQ